MHADRRQALGLRNIQYILLIICEAAWIYPWTLALEGWFGQKREPVLSTLALAALLAAATVVTRVAAHILLTLGVPLNAGGDGSPHQHGALERGRAPRWRRLGRVAAAYVVRALLVLAGLAAAALVAMSELPTAREHGPGSEAWNQLLDSSAGVRAAQAGAVAAMVWWRGIRLGRSMPSLYVVEDQFFTGMTALVCLLVLAGLAGRSAPLPTDSLLLSTLTFVFSGLVGVPLARVVEVSERERRRGGPGLAPGGSWLAVLVTIVCGLLLAALLLAQLLSFERIVAVWQALESQLGAIMWKLLYLLAIPVGLLVQLLVFLASLLPRGAQKPPRQPTDLDWLSRLRQQQEEVPPIAPEVIAAIKMAVLATAVAAFVWVVVRAIARLGQQWEVDGVEEVHDYVWSWGELRALWRWLLARWRPIRTRTLFAMKAASTERSANSMRGLYREFLMMGAALSVERQPSETPLEYEQRLRADQSLPGAEEIRLITQGYVEERYGRPASRPRELAPIAAALARLRALWHDRLR